MFGKRVRLFRLSGFTVYIHMSWIFVAVLITWSLIGGVFPRFYPDLTSGTYIWMGIAGALGFFGSIILHELSHSLAARRYGLPMKGICPVRESSIPWF